MIAQTSTSTAASWSGDASDRSVRSRPSRSGLTLWYAALLLSNNSMNGVREPSVCSGQFPIGMVCSASVHVSMSGKLRIAIPFVVAFPTPSI